MSGITKQRIDALLLELGLLATKVVAKRPQNDQIIDFQHFDSENNFVGVKTFTKLDFDFQRHNLVTTCHG